MYTEEEAEEARQDGVDLLEEGWLLALSRSSIYQQSLRRYYNRKVRPRSFQEGDLVLRLIQRTAGQHKLSAPWEGPFIISKVLGNDAYYLIDAQKPRARKRDDSGKETERPWNANLLRRFAFHGRSDSLPESSLLRALGFWYRSGSMSRCPRLC